MDRWWNAIVEVTVPFDTPEQARYAFTEDYFVDTLIEVFGNNAVIGGRVEVATDADSEAPLYLGISEIATLLGVSKQRVGQLSRHPDFPQPVARLRCGPVWTGTAVNLFLADWPRRGGRPPKPAAEQTARHPSY